MAEEPLRAGRARARAAAKCAVARVAGLDAGTVELRTGPSGLPEPVVPGGDDIWLSLTHSHGRGAAVALRAGFGLRAGIDLERDGAVAPERARYFLTAAERGHADAHGRELTDLWSLKEAAWKALRLDDTVHFAALELQFDDLDNVAGLTLDGRPSPARAVISHPWPGFVLAVVLVGQAA